MSSTPPPEDVQPIPTTTDSQTTEPNGVASQDSEAAASQPQKESASEWDVLRARVRARPSDTESWLRLVDVAVASGDYAKTNETYEALLEAYPNTVRTFLEYITYYISSLL
jgi:cleavage stimulation factor subunit 3